MGEESFKVSQSRISMQALSHCHVNKVFTISEIDRFLGLWMGLSELRLLRYCLGEENTLSAVLHSGS